MIVRILVGRESTVLLVCWSAFKYHNNKERLLLSST